MKRGLVVLVVALVAGPVLALLLFSDPFVLENVLKKPEYTHVLEKNFGTVKVISPPLRFDFSWKNPTSHSLEVGKTTKSCTCAELVLNSQSIPANGHLRGTMTVHPYGGPIDADALVYFRHGCTPLKIRVKGFGHVEHSFSVEPKTIRVESGWKGIRELRLREFFAPDFDHEAETTFSMTGTPGVVLRGVELEKKYRLDDLSIVRQYILKLEIDSNSTLSTQRAILYCDYKAERSEVKIVLRLAAP